MKKLMKAIAFATVMCMLLSTAAFAAVPTAGTNAEGTKAELTDTARTLNVTIAGAATTGAEPVSLIVVDAGAADFTSDTILYVAQADSASGVATFNGITIADETVTAVDIYSGNATYAAANTNTVQKLANVALEEEVTEVVVSVRNASRTIADDLQSEAKDYTGAALSLIADFTEGVPEGYTLSKIVWAFNVDGDTERRYTKSIDAAAAGFTILEGAIQTGVAINNGSTKQNIDAESIVADSTDVIFLFVKGTGEETQTLEAYTNKDADYNNRSDRTAVAE